MAESPTFIQALESEYKTDAGRFATLCGEVVKQVEELLKDERINLASPIEYRVKTWASITDKISRNQIEPKSLAEIRDIAGIRIIALFRRDVESIQKIIEDNFTVLIKEDTFARLNDNQFGYGSIHYEVQPPDGWSKVPTLKKLTGLWAEIQVRTGSQHIWAAASHILQYKKEVHVPPPLRRTINRVAALLETVDMEFERVLAEREDYTKQISDLKDDIPLNTESLRRLLDATLPAENRDEEDPEDYADLLDELVHFNITSTFQFAAIVKRHLSEVLKEDKQLVMNARSEIERGGHHPETSKERNSRNVYFTHVGLARGTLQLEFPTEFTKYLADKNYIKFDKSDSDEK